MKTQWLRQKRQAGAVGCVTTVLFTSIALATLVWSHAQAGLSEEANGAPRTDLSAICWLLVSAGILGTALASCGARFGWLLLFGLQPIWIAYAICTEQNGLVLGCLAYGAAQINGFFRNNNKRNA